MNTRIAAMAISLALAGPACAEPTAAEAIRLHRLKSSETTSYLSGLAAGFAWAEADRSARNEPMLFCPPRMAQTVDQQLSILEQYLERFPSLADGPVGSAMLRALHDRFPCQRN
jgi:hypothetical protein